jgi:hypothetical protein
MFIVPLIICVCVGLPFSPAHRTNAQGVSAIQPIGTTENKTALPDAQLVPALIAAGVEDANIARAVLVIRFVLAVSGVAIIWLAFAQKQGTFNLFTPFCGQLLLIDAATFRGQLNWWLASNGNAYGPAIGLALPGVIGSALIFAFVIVLPTDQRRIQRIILSVIALCLLIASLSLSYSAWPK